MKPDYGRTAYETYRSLLGGRSLSGLEMPPFEDLDPVLRKFWGLAAGAAIRERETGVFFAVEDEPQTIPVAPFKDPKLV